MLYKGEFKSRGGELYTVEIVTNNDSTVTVNMAMGPSPFTTSMDGSADTIYTPLKATSATIQFVGNGYQFDLYSSSAKQNPVTLYDHAGNIIWKGYTQPNAYSVPFDFVTETYTVECLDALGILQYYDYELIPESGQDASTATKGFRTFQQIIDSILAKTGCITKWYFSTATSIYQRGGCMVKLLTISDANFFDEDNEAMKMDEVLTEICKYCNVTAVVKGTEVYFMDYDAIKAGVNNYYQFTVGNSTPTTVTVSHSKTIAEDDYKETGSRLTLDNTYSKVTVTDSLYSVDSILPSMFEDDDLQNVYYVNEDNQNWGYEMSGSCQANGHYFNVKSRFYNNKKFNHYYYNPTTGAEVTGPILSTKDAQTKLGIQFTKFNVGVGDNAQESLSNLKYGQWDNYLMLPVNDTSISGKVKMQSKVENANPFFISSDVKLVAKGQMILTDRGNFSNDLGYFPDTGNLEGAYDYGGWFIFTSGSEYAITKGCLSLTLTLNMGSYSGSFNVPFYEVGKQSEWLYENKKKHEIFYKSFNIQNNVTYNDKVDEEGYKLVIPNISAGTIIAAKPTFSIKGMDSMAQFGQSGLNCVSCVFIKDFDIVGIMPHEGGKDENDTDTEYSYDIDEDYVNELQKIDFKICTWDNKQLNYSAVAYHPANDNNYQFLDKVYNAGTGETVRPEQQLCYRIVHQYSGRDSNNNYVGPCKKLELKLKNDIKPYTLVTEPTLNIEMIVDSMDTDYVNDAVSLNLIEKR